MRTLLGKILRIIAILFLGITAAMNILSGVGTTCAAFLTRSYPPYTVLIEEGVQWLWQAFVVLTIALGVAMVWGTIKLARSRPASYGLAVILLIAGSVLNGIHVYASAKILDGIMPIAAVMAINVITLILFLLFGIPGLRSHIQFEQPADERAQAAGGLTALITGAIVLTTSLWAGPSHMMNGANLVNVLRVPLLASGTLLMAGGALSLLLVSLPRKLTEHRVTSPID